MKIDKFKLIIEPCWDNRKKMKVIVYCNGTRHEWTEIWPDEDFTSIFHRYMEKAEYMVKEKIKELED